mmetsp:Transcript_5634/g.14782  ORF Transcript_5634/g.14782 Transcript_5634/m.14782 type:complete len:251 (-) Transcript_5634:62-814(-)
MVVTTQEQRGWMACALSRRPRWWTCATPTLGGQCGLPALLRIWCPVRDASLRRLLAAQAAAACCKARPARSASAARRMATRPLLDQGGCVALQRPGPLHDASEGPSTGRRPRPHAACLRHANVERRRRLHLPPLAAPRRRRPVHRLRRRRSATRASCRGAQPLGGTREVLPQVQARSSVVRHLAHRLHPISLRRGDRRPWPRPRQLGIARSTTRARTHTGGGGARARARDVRPGAVRRRIAASAVRVAGA